MGCRSLILILAGLFLSGSGFSQDSMAAPGWDNLMFISNKVAGGLGKWRYSGDFQVRLDDDLTSLERWLIEGTVTRLATKHLEFQLPLRYTVKPDAKEFRPGFGAIAKVYPGQKIQWNHQVLYQADITKAETQHGMRYVSFVNYVINEKLVPNAAAGVFYRWSDDFDGLQFVRLVGGLSYFIDVKHSFNVSYFVGWQDIGGKWVTNGGPILQLVFNIDKNYKYLPAKYYNF